MTILDFPGLTTQPFEPDKVLDAAKGKLKEVLVIGFCDDEQFDLWVSSSTSSIPIMIWMMERAKKLLLQEPFDGE